MRRIHVLFFSWLLLPMLAAGQAQSGLAIRAGRLIDGRSEKPQENVLIQVEGDKIISVTVGAWPERNRADIRLSGVNAVWVRRGFAQTKCCNCSSMW